MAIKWFLDTAYAIALSSPKDHFHEHAVKLSQEIEKTGIYLVTTRAVILEIGNALSKLHYRQAAVRLLDAIEKDPSIEVIPLSE